jgi:hypothetical protein
MGYKSMNHVLASIIILYKMNSVLGEFGVNKPDLWGYLHWMSSCQVYPQTPRRKSVLRISTHQLVLLLITLYNQNFVDGRALCGTVCSNPNVKQLRPDMGEADRWARLSIGAMTGIIETTPSTAFCGGAGKINAHCSATKVGYTNAEIIASYDSALASIQAIFAKWPVPDEGNMGSKDGELMIAAIDIGGETFTHGLYGTPSTLANAAGILTLDGEGDPDAHIPLASPT